MTEQERMRHDESYKALFGFRRLVEDLLRDFVAPQIQGGAEWVERLDFETLAPMPTERIDPAFRARISDMVWRIGFRDATDEQEPLHVLLMLEFQSKVHWFMAFRVLEYITGLYRSLLPDRDPVSSDRLPPVLAVVIYNGKNRWRAATSMAQLVAVGACPAGGGSPPPPPTYTGEQYVLVDLGAYDLDALPVDNLVSLMVQAERFAGAADMERVLEGLLRLLESEEYRELRERFLGWLRLLVQRAGVDLEFLEDRVMLEQIRHSGELRPTLEERFQARFDALRAEGEERGLRQGLRQGEERGLQKGQEQGLQRERQLLVRQADRKFGTELREPVARLLAAIDDPDRLQDIGEWIVDCELGSELLARLSGAT